MAATRKAARGKRTRTMAIASRRVLPPDPPRDAQPLRRMLLDGRRLDMQIGDRLVGARLMRTIEGASTLTLDVWDGDRAVQRSGVFGRIALASNLRVQLDGLGYYVAGVDKSGDTLSVTCEDEVILTLKRHGIGKPLRVSRNKATRAAFVATMIRQAGAPVIVLDEGVIQPIAGLKSLREELAKANASNSSADIPGEKPKKGRKSAKGVTASGLTLGGKAVTSEQRRNIATVLRVAAEEKAQGKATLALVMACIVESPNFTNPASGDASSQGILQLLASTASGLGISPRDIEACCRAFLRTGFTGKGGAIALARKNPTWTAGMVAQACQGSAFPDRYDQVRDDAVKVVEAGGGVADGGDSGTAYIKPFAYERMKDESTWACARRLLDEVQWRLFVREGVVVIASDPALMRARPSLSISERTEAVESLDYSWHRALQIGEMTGKAYVGRYQADPGEVVDVDDLPVGDRRWLLASVTSELLGEVAAADIALRQPRDPKAEPAPEVVTRAASGDIGSGATGTATALFEACKAISDKNYPYVWGGGHAKAGTPDNGTGRDPGIGYDCSGSCCAALAAAGLGYKVGGPVDVSGSMAATYGKPGEGKHATVWANAQHVFITFSDGWQFNTAGHPGISGARLLKQNYSTSGFTPRHPEGL